MRRHVGVQREGDVVRAVERVTGRVEDAALVGQEGKPESYYFPPQYNNVDNNFCYTFMGLEPGTTKEQLRRCLEDWNKGDPEDARVGSIVPTGRVVS